MTLTKRVWSLLSGQSGSDCWMGKKIITLNEKIVEHGVLAFALATMKFNKILR